MSGTPRPPAIAPAAEAALRVLEATTETDQTVGVRRLTTRVAGRASPDTQRRVHRRLTYLANCRSSPIEWADDAHVRVHLSV